MLRIPLSVTLIHAFQVFLHLLPSATRLRRERFEQGQYFLFRGHTDPFRGINRPLQRRRQWSQGTLWGWSVFRRAPVAVPVPDRVPMAPCPDTPAICPTTP